MEPTSRQTATLLWEAVSRGEHDEVRALLARDVSPDTPTGLRNAGRYSPLHYAAATGDRDLATLLLSNGARADGGNRWATPLVTAAEAGQVALVEILLEAGAEPTPYFQSAIGERDALVEALGAAPELVGASDENKATLQHVAAGSLRLDIVRVLLARGADVSACDRLGATPLHRACDHRSPLPDRQVPVLEALVSVGADIDARNARKVTPLHLAVRARSLAGVRFLLEHGAEVDPVDAGRQTTPLRRAVTNTGAGGTGGRQEQALEIARVLLEHGADPHHEDRKGRPVVTSARSASMCALLEQYRTK